MEIKWNDAPVSAPLVFSRDVFDKFTLAPNVKELFTLLHNSSRRSEESGEKKPDGPPSVSNVLASDELTSECKPTKAKPVKRAETAAFPEPLVPYPRFSTLNVKNRKMYLNMLVRKNYFKASKCLTEQVKNEVTEFMKYLQDVSRACSDGYSYMPPGSSRYTEEYLTACLEHVKSYPQVYSIQEISGLTSVKFMGDLSLNFEKQLLAMGKIDMLDKKVMAENTQLPVDYETVANVVPPAKKATLVHTAISNDSNAEKLCATYEPQVCLSKEAFLQLLNNNSEFTEAWELPVWVRENPMNGSSRRKTAYIDPPLLKTELSWRERSLLFHQESVKLAFKKTVSRPVFFLTSEELPVETQPPPEDKISRSVAGLDDAGMDFGTDLTDLESFGESYKPSKKVKEQNEPKTASATPSQHIPSLKRQTDSRPQTQGTAAEVSSDPATPDPANPSGKGTKKGVKRARISGECDQLGQILKMQDAMLKSTPSKNQEPVKPRVPEDKAPEVKTHSLVKQCVTSYLESREGQEEDTTLPADVPLLLATQRKRLLKEDLQGSAEDEMDFDPPAEGSVLYKLYSLLDVLLLVRSSVDIAHPRHDKDTFRAVPVHVLPKLEYQLCYGAESLTHTEACQLWAEKLLHSSTVSFISRINAHTSEVAHMQMLPDDWIQSVTCDFKPARCLNTLYHLLKKVSSLQEGRYLLVHKPREGFLTIFKASDETKAARGVYNLQNAHCGPPAVSPGIPWVPLDPSCVLPFHLKHSRPPCTFPPRPPPQAKGETGPKQLQGKCAVRPPQATNQNQSTKKRKKGKKKRAWRDNMRVKIMKDQQKTQTSERGKDGKP
ncbi:little elongation complex subunit 2-like isoform X3 [Carassius auratus]|uniref:Little elongation complex subunit 2-like isoform X3 n=1 Tax=Carassius auratus TaxID=7957 RepID=A0A6P6PC08_CARAU|nr:little elongation complex subunit 2-like isoform X3 [Carassius auratus]